MAGVKDFDRFISEREDKKMTVRVFGRECKVPSELPWHYVMKVEALLHKGVTIPGEENFKLLKQMFSDEDYKYITEHPDFRPSYVWELIAFTWLRQNEDEKPAQKVHEFRTEDDMRIDKTRGGSGEKKE